MVGNPGLIGQALMRSHADFVPKHVSGNTLPTLAIMLASLAYLVPAGVALRAKLMWQAVLFTLMALLSAAAHACGDVSLAATQCSVHMRSSLPSAAGACAFLCVLQLAFLMLGSESTHACKSTGLMSNIKGLGGTALYGIVLSRVVPVLVLWHTLLAPGSPLPQDVEFWRRGGLATEILLCVGCGALWLFGPERSTPLSAITQQTHFWRRVLYCLVAPLATALAIGITAAQTGSWGLWIATHISGAAAAAYACRVAQQVFEEDASNETMSQIVLCLPAGIMIPTAMFALWGDYLKHGVWRWPSLSMAETSQLGGLILTLAALPLGIATCLAGSVIARYHDQGKSLTPLELFDFDISSLWKNRLRQFSVKCALASMIFGVIAAMIVEGSHLGNTLHTFFAVLQFAAAYIAILALTLVSDLMTWVGMLRMFIGLGCAIGMPLHLVFFLYANQFIPNNNIVPHAVYATSEYLQMLFMFAIPITSWEEAKLQPEMRAG